MWQDAQLNRIASTLSECGYVALDKALPDEFCRQLAYEARNGMQAYYREAGVGRGGLPLQDKNIRGDQITWLSGQTPVQSEWLHHMEALRVALNERLFLGLFSFESHYAHYAPGTFYQKHLDAFRGRSNRILSTVFYLNEAWQSNWGGELGLYSEHNQEELLEKVEPMFGRMVIFLSDTFPHEVKAASKDRYSIAGWFRVNSSDSKQIDPNA